MHWSLRLAIRVPVLLPLWCLWRVGVGAEMLGDKLEEWLPDGISRDEKGKWL